jgi:hypothetical protein
MIDPEADLEASLSDSDRALLDGFADAISRRRLTSAALFVLESMKPMGFLGSQAMVFLRPIVAIVWRDPARWDQLQRILEQRGSIELLLRRLEARV